MIKVSRRFLNYFFIGPPGSGKSTIAAHLAAAVPNYTHVDTDRDILEKSWGITVAEKLDKIGNENFVAAESETTRAYLERRRFLIGSRFLAH